MEAVDDKEMSLDASSFYAKKGGVVDSSDDETEGPGASGRGAPGKIMIEIKPLSAMTNAKTNEKPLDAFSFAPPPRARMSARVDAVEGVNADSNATSTTDRPENEAPGTSAAVDVAKDGSDEAQKTKRGGLSQVTRDLEALTTMTASKSVAVPTRSTPRPKPLAVDPYDMLDAIVGTPTADSSGIDSVTVDRHPTSSPPSRSSLQNRELNALNGRGGGREHEGRTSNRSIGGGSTSGAVSPRGGVSRGSFGAESSAFYEELAQISLPDTDTINPQREFNRGVELFDANKLSEALFAFVAGAVNAVHSGDPIALRCAAYATTCKILRDCSTLLAGNVSECARLTRHLVALPRVEDRHRRASLRFASAKNFKVGNAGVAGEMIKELMSITSSSNWGNLEAMLAQCEMRGQRNDDVPETEDPKKMCAATLESIPKSANGIECKACGALHSTKAAFETGQCVICRSTLAGTRQNTRAEASWF